MERNEEKGEERASRWGKLRERTGTRPILRGEGNVIEGETRKKRDGIECEVMWRESNVAVHKLTRGVWLSTWKDRE